MKTFATLLLIAAAALAANLATAAGENDRPLAVEEVNWIPISERLGFVVTPDPHERAGHSALSVELMPPLKGYFVVKTAGGWRRMSVINPVELSKL